MSPAGQDLPAATRSGADAPGEFTACPVLGENISVATEGGREHFGTPRGFCEVSRPPSPVRESLQVLLPEVAPNWEEGNKTGVKVGLGRQRGASHPPGAPFWETSKPPGAQRRCLCSLAVRIKARGGKARAEHGKLSQARGPPAPEPGDARHHPELPPPPCSHGIPAAVGGRSQGLQHPNVGVPMCPQGWDRDHPGAQHHRQGLGAGK